MGKKIKTGKARRDSYYFLAKESGYRSRAAFKLLQLNQKFRFLPSSQICIDLCAAPGGWLQVAFQEMPISKLILGIDLVPIKPIHHSVLTFQEDITSDKCRQTLKKELQTRKADVVLHDGAPNVGKNWVHDAFQQVQLTLKALKLACDFLRRGGWFVTKVFRSKDYPRLVWAFKQLFKKVSVTKPKASRNESAEIFVVCQYFLAPDKLDPKLTDYRFVFEDTATEETEKEKATNIDIELFRPDKTKKKKADGYAENDATLCHKVKASDFLKAENFKELLVDCHQIILDADWMLNHKATTLEIKECCRDVRVLGPKEMRELLKWRNKLNKYLEEENSADKQQSEVDNDKNENSDEEVEGQIASMKDEKRRVLKRKRKKDMKEKRKVRDKLQRKMIIPGDVIEQSEDLEIFNLTGIKNQKELETLEDGDERLDENSDGDDEIDEEPKKCHKATLSYDRSANDVVDETDEDENEEDIEEDELHYSDDNSDLELEEEDDNIGASKDESGDNPLVVDFAGTSSDKAKARAKMWFERVGLSTMLEEDLEIKKLTEEYKKKGGKASAKNKKSKIETKKERKENKKTKKSSLKDEDSSFVDDEEENKIADNGDSEMDENSDNDDEESAINSFDEDEEMFDNKRIVKEKRGRKKLSGGIEIVSEGETVSKRRKFDPVSLAIGEVLIKSQKSRRDLTELSFNRYAFDDDDGLPSWFTKDESRHNKVQLPITKEQVEAYKSKQRAIDAKPVKKIAEAIANRKRKLMKKVERARKKAESISDSVEVTDREKFKKMKEVYKKAGLLRKQKEEVTYVVARKGATGRRVRRPPGVKGRYKVVDPRLKKDIRQQKIAEKKKKGKSGGSGKRKHKRT